ncbi:MAG: ABC transporter permease [Oscillospiraceae bacterium]|nr:ABC transporter permease [Oscillospiraceae bacterium]
MIVFTTTVKRILKQPLNWVFIMIFPIVSFILISISAAEKPQQDIAEISVYFGVADNDDTLLSRALANQLGLRYNIIEVEEADVTAVLTDGSIPWVLLINEGYEQDVLERNFDLTSLEGYSLTVTDTSAIGAAMAENITRALMLLGTNDQTVISAWEETSQVEIQLTNLNDHWAAIAQWLAMFGFISIFTAYFIIKTLLDDKRGGMPDRVGVLPISTRTYLTQGSLAAFVVTELTVGLSLAVLEILYSGISNIWFLFLLLSLYNLFSVSLVLSITSFAKDLGAASVAMTMIATLSAMLGGLFWPMALVPEFMQKVAWFTPGYWFAEGLRNINEITFEGFVMPLLFLFGFTVITLLIGGLKKVQKMDE